MTTVGDRGACGILKATLPTSQKVERWENVTKMGIYKKDEHSDDHKVSPLKINLSDAEEKIY